MAIVYYDRNEAEAYSDDKDEELGIFSINFNCACPQTVAKAIEFSVGCVILNTPPSRC